MKEKKAKKKLNFSSNGPGNRAFSLTHRMELRLVGTQKRLNARLPCIVRWLGVNVDTKIK
jgi:hypothetical protein